MGSGRKEQPGRSRHGQITRPQYALQENQNREAGPWNILWARVGRGRGFEWEFEGWENRADFLGRENQRCLGLETRMSLRTKKGGLGGRGLADKEEHSEERCRGGLGWLLGPPSLVRSWDFALKSVGKRQRVLCSVCDFYFGIGRTVLKAA